MKVIVVKDYETGAKKAADVIEKIVRKKSTISCKLSYRKRCKRRSYYKIRFR